MIQNGIMRISEIYILEIKNDPPEAVEEGVKAASKVTVAREAKVTPGVTMVLGAGVKRQGHEGSQRSRRGSP